MDQKNSVGAATSTTTQLRDEEGDDTEIRPRETLKGEFVKSILMCRCLDLQLVADGISMGFGDFASSSTEKDVAAKERAVTEWDVSNHGGTEELELLRKYKNAMDNRGCVHVLRRDATTVVNIFAKYKEILVDEKTMPQNGMLPPDQADKPWKHGLVTFVAFLLFGSVPLLFFIVLIPFTHSDIVKFVGACILTAFALVLLGLAKAKIAGQNYAFFMVVTLFNGAIAAAAAYTLGSLLTNVAGLE
ncbi:hypothetical protein I3842_01G050100 [Carya illinoinensis]|uniref:Vacuolar iron transporter n=1 Tax=Carya illinoinensis TaxID=32201 RepID=A0A922FZU9_CARIL|nr:hypothetical protein I3842_01G050100 [Carya illinoinensis]